MADLFRYRIMASYVPTRDRGGNVSHLYTRDVDDVIVGVLFILLQNSIVAMFITCV